MPTYPNSLDQSAIIILLEDKSVFDGEIIVLTFKLKFELRSRLSHQPVLEDFLRPQLIRFHLN